MALLKVAMPLKAGRREAGGTREGDGVRQE